MDVLLMWKSAGLTRAMNKACRELLLCCGGQYSGSIDMGGGHYYSGDVFVDSAVNIELTGTAWQEDNTTSHTHQHTEVLLPADSNTSYHHQRSKPKIHRQQAVCDYDEDDDDVFLVCVNLVI